jgi:adenylylsulfate kinase
MKETHKRSIMKSLTWRFLATVTTMTLVYIYTGNLEIMVSVGFFEVIAKLAIYYLHERAWNIVKWGVVNG